MQCIVQYYSFRICFFRGDTFTLHWPNFKEKILPSNLNSSSAGYKITLVQRSKQELAHQSMKFYWGLDKETDMNIF